MLLFSFCLGASAVRTTVMLNLVASPPGSQVRTKEPMSASLLWSTRLLGAPGGATEARLRQEGTVQRPLEKPDSRQMT